MVTLHEDQCTSMIISRCTLRKMRSYSRCREKQNKQNFLLNYSRCRENQNKHFLLNVFFPRESCSLEHKVEKCVRTRQDADDNIIRRMRFACWVTEITDTHSRVCSIYQSVYVCQLMHNWIFLKASLKFTLKFTLKQLHHVSV
jgi:hypothetical protein